MNHRETPQEPQQPHGQESEKPSGWAERIDGQGKKRWRKQEEQSKGSRAAGYIAAIIINLVLLFVANNLLNWNVPFLTSEFIVPLSILNISLSATILANLIFLMYDPRWFLAITRTVLNIIGVVFTYVFYTTFPFDFSSLASAGLVTLLMRIVLILGIIGSAIGVIAEFSKFIKAILTASRG